MDQNWQEWLRKKALVFGACARNSDVSFSRMRHFRMKRFVDAAL